jgi:gluconate 2-dehydrogenase alpha chain
MATDKRAEVDVVVVGLGWAGSVIARELTRAGLRVVALERGPARSPERDFALPSVRDELRYAHRHELFQDTALETVTLRHEPNETALPMRRLGAFLPGTGSGGAGSHWNGLHFRLLPSDLRLRSHLEQRYGKRALPPELGVADFGVSYDELEPHYDRFEKLCGVSGKAGNLRGNIVAGGNPFEGARSDDYPNRPLHQTLTGEIFGKAASELGYHPFPAPAANASAAYVNPEGLTLGACAYCGHCERFGCETNAKASPNVAVLPALLAEPGFELRNHAYVKSLRYDREKRRVTAVSYVDTRTGREVEQPAGLVVLSAYVFNNVLLLLTSGIGKPYDPQSGRGAVGKSYCYQVGSGVQVFVEDKTLNPFMGAGALATVIDDLNGDNFDHTGLGFFGGAWIGASTSGGRPIAHRPVPPGTPRWGAAWKKATARWYNHAFTIGVSGANYAHPRNYLDLDPTYRDALGRPLVRMTYDFRENDVRLVEHCAAVASRIARATGATIVGEPRARPKHFSVVPYQTTHNTGGAIMGEDPRSSVVNRYLQAWDAHNLFVVGASAFPQNASYNPTGTVGALAYWTAAAIVQKYLKTPGPLVHA